MDIFTNIGTYFSHILLTLVVVTGAISLIAKIKNSNSVIAEYSKSLFPVFFIVFVLRSFIVEPYRIPSGSMLPTLEVGDYILVSKYKYGIRFPVWNKKIINVGDPKRGDMVVFRFPEDPKINFIKRLVGLPGDEILYENKQLYINGQQLDLLRDGTYAANNFSRWQQSLGDVKHSVLIDQRMPDRPWPVAGKKFVVPEGNYFVMGDNRDQSHDSRAWGFVPEENLVGKAFYIWFSMNQGERTGDDSDEGVIDWERIGTSLNP